ncbi:MAG: oligosaccharide flippase family protein [Bacilli bacterium]|nr:oligosaccharide flippase family protein [Bacilli bacterium]
MDKNNKLLNNTLSILVSTFINRGLMFIMLPFFCRWLSVEEMGIYDVIMTYLALLLPIITLATANGIFGLTTNDSSLKINITNGLVLHVVNSIIAIFVVFIINNVVKFEYAYFLMILLILEVFDNYLLGCLRAIRKLEIYALSKTFNVVITVLISVFFIKICGMHLSGLLLGYIVGYFVSCVYQVIAINLPKIIHLRLYSFSKIKELIAYSYPLIINDISWWIINVSDRVIINAFIGATANGIYAVANKISNICIVIMSSFNFSWQEAIIDKDEENKQSYINKIYNKLLTITVSLCSILISCSFIIYGIFFDERYIEAKQYGEILVITTVFHVISMFLGGIQISLNNPKANGYSTTFGAVVNLLIHLSLVNFMGLYAAAISTVVSNITVMIIRWMWLPRKYAIKSTKKTKYAIAILLYYAICSYIQLSMVFRIINLILAILSFIIINKSFVNEVLSKVIKKIN